MITSTMYYAPGMTILESKDLVNWKIIGHVFEKIDWHPKYNWDVMDGYSFGVWAGDLAYNDGKWYCYFIDATLGLYVSYAENIKGPWTSAKLMLKNLRWTDPAVYWDEDGGQAYLVCNYGREHGKDVSGDGKPDNELRMFIMSWDGLTLLDEVKGMTPGQFAGLCRLSGQYVLIGIKVNKEGERILTYQNNEKIIDGPQIKSAIIYFRTNNNGRNAYYSYSLNGKNWEKFGSDFTLTFGRWRGDRIGFFCWNEYTDKKEGYVDFDWFHYDKYDGPKSLSK